MKLRLCRNASFVLALGAASAARALGLGDIHVASRLGQPLRAEVQLSSAPDEKPQAACFRLAPQLNPGDDIPWLTRARVELQVRGGSTFLAITTKEPVNEPILMLGLQAGCSFGLTREFALLLPAPEALQSATVEPARDSPPAAADAPHGVAPAARGGGEVAAAESAAAARAKGPQPMRATSSTGDRLQVGAKTIALAGLGGKQRRQLSREEQLMRQLEDRVVAYEELADRIKKMEARAVELKEQLSRVEAALETATAANSARRERMAMATGQAPAVVVGAPAPAAREVRKDESISDWLMGSLFGGSTLGVLLFLHARRRKLQRVPTLTATADAAAGRDAAPSGRPASNAVPLSASDDMDAIQVDEHGSVIELAEIMLALGITKGAAETLLDYIESHPKQSVLPSLKLLEIYRENGGKSEFEQLAKRLNQTFNANVIDWEGREHAPDSLARFGHIMDRLVTSWGKPECLDYLRHLLEDNRNGSRSGFTPKVLEDIVLLTSILEHQQAVAAPELGVKAA